MKEDLHPISDDLPPEPLLAREFRALTDDLTHDQFVKFLFRLWATGYSVTFAGLRKFRQELGLEVD